MTRIHSISIALILGCVPMTSYGADDPGESHQLAKATLEAARQGLKNEQAVFRGQELFWWSQRILFAELELGETPRARIEALQNHLNRCKEFEEKIVELRRQGAMSNQTSVEARYFRLRAQYWLAKEKLIQTRERSRVPPSAAFPGPITPAMLDHR